MEIPVSLIIPNYNKAAYLDACLESVFRQKARPSEVLVIDDNSNDGSREILSLWEKRHPGVIRMFFLEENRGVGYARNLGLREAINPFLTTLDSDDFLMGTNKFSAEWNAIKTTNVPYPIAFSGVSLVDDLGNPLCDQPTFLIKEGNLRYQLPGRKIFVPRDFIYPRSLAEEVGNFNERLNLFEDFDYKLRLSHKGTFIFSGVNGIGYRQGAGGLSSVPKRKHLAAYRAVCRWNFRMESRYIRLKMIFQTELGLLRLYRRHYRWSSSKEIKMYLLLLKNSEDSPD